MSLYRKITVVTSSNISLPLINFLHKNGLLRHVAVPYSNTEVASLIAGFIPKEHILISDAPAEPNIAKDTDLIIVMGYVYKLVPGASAKMINVHFGSLPENRGPDPIFRTISQGKSLAYIAVHEIDHDWDSGSVLLERGYSLMPGDNYGMVMSRLSHQTIEVIGEFLTGHCDGKPQAADEARYFSRPSEEELTITWDSMKAGDIENLINACNPKYQGARTGFNGGPLSIVEVDQTAMTMAEGQPPPPGGTIVHASVEHGLFVICSDHKFLKINIVSTPEGVFSGHKLVAMGVGVGTKFEVKLPNQ